MPVRYTIDPQSLHRIRAILIGKREENISWRKFAKITGVSFQTLSNIRLGQSNGSYNTGATIIQALNESDGMIISHEFMQDHNKPEPHFLSDNA